MEFDSICERAKAKWDALVNRSEPVIYFGTASCGRAAGAMAVKDAAEEALQKLKINANLVEVGCIGPCCFEPLIYIQKPGKQPICYSNIVPDKVETLLKGYLIDDDPQKELALGILGDNAIYDIPSIFEHPMLKPQVRLVLRNCGIINPYDIDHYIAHDGYQAIKTVLTKTPEEVIEEIKISGLRGRGGAGFPTHMKWKFCRDAAGQPKYLICNADEGDPGAFMDRSVLEGDPHSVLEGMIIGAYAIEASGGVIYCRAEYPLAIKRLQIAIDQAREKGYLGKNIVGIEGFDFDIYIKEGAGAFVCGEETALIASVEGQRGMPRKRPPFPAASGLWKKPTNINNVETLANVPWIIQHGAEEYAKYGTEKSKGTKVFALAGKIKRSGLVEVPMGMTVKDVIFKLGGGIQDNKEFKAVQMGGPSGGCIPAHLSHTIVDYDSVNATGAIMGSGGMVVMDETTCMVDVARFFLDFTQKESCGKCTFCRIGTKRMLEILTRITEGKGEEGDIEQLEELSYQIKDNSLCGLGQTAPNPVLTTIKYFRDEYEAHIRDKKCPAMVCTNLLTYEVDETNCTGCTVCAKNCPVDAISGERKQLHHIDQDVCIKCGICYTKCKFEAINLS